MSLFALQLGLTGGSLLGRWLTRNDPPLTRPVTKPAAQGTAYPRAGMGGAIPLLFGTVRVEAPSVAWSGNEYAEISGAGTTEIYRGADMLLVLGTPAWDEAGAPWYAWRLTSPRRLLSVWINDQRHVFSPPLVHRESASVNFSLGGRGAGGTFSAVFEFHDGRPDQSLTGTPKPKIELAFEAANLGIPLDTTLVPGYRHQMCVAVITSNPANGLGGGIKGTFGEEGSAPTMRFEVESLGPQPVSVDANPAWVLYDLICGRVWKMGLDVARMDLPSFQAAATTLVNEGHGYSVGMYQSASVTEMIGEILSQINATLFEDASTRTVKLKLIRSDYNIATIPQMTTSNTMGRPRITTNGWHDVATQLEVKYTSRADLYRPGRAPVGRLANSVAAAFKRNTRTLNFPGCTTRTLADTIAARELATVARPLITGTAILNREFYSVLPGDAVLANWPEINIVNKVFRVVNPDYGQLADGTISVTLVEDVFG